MPECRATPRCPRGPLAVYMFHSVSSAERAASVSLSTCRELDARGCSRLCVNSDAESPLGPGAQVPERYGSVGMRADGWNPEYDAAPDAREQRLQAQGRHR